MRRGAWVPLTLAVAAAPPAEAAQRELVPSLTARAEATDNLGFAARDEAADLVWTVGPQLQWRRTDERGRLAVEVGADAVRHREETALDRERVTAAADGSWRAAERLELGGQASYLQDWTLESELRETGVVTRAADRYRGRGQGRLGVKATERDEVTARYAFARTAYQDPGSADHDAHEADLTWRHALASERDAVTLGPSWTRLRSAGVQVDHWGAALGWTRALSPTASATASLGGRYSEIAPRRGPGAAEHHRGMVGTLSLESRSEVTTVGVGASRDLSFGADGAAVERDRVYTRIHRNLGPRLWAGVRADLSWTRTEGPGGDDRARYAEVSPSVGYRLTEHHVVRAAYRWAATGEATKNQLWLELALAWPPPW